MSASERAEAVRGLRQLADLLEDERLPMPSTYALGIDTFLPAIEEEGLTDDQRRVKAGAQLHAAIRALGGKVEKQYVGSTLGVKKSLAGGVEIRVHARRDQVCRRKVVGYTEVPAYTYPARREEKVEWECDPLLTIGDES